MNDEQKGRKRATNDDTTLLDLYMLSVYAATFVFYTLEVFNLWMVGDYAALAFWMMMVGPFVSGVMGVFWPVVLCSGWW